MASVTFDKATRLYPGGTKPAVDQLEIEIADGEFLVLVGPSGCGKSTSLRMLAGLEDVNGGAIRIGDRDVTHLPPKDRDIAMVFQNYALYPHMTVADNMGFALKIAGVNKTEIRAKVEEAAKILDLTEYLDRKPKALSGGQRQRVAMGRAIVREPQVFLMDEPLSNLDAKLRVSTRTQIASLQRRLGITTVYVTHDQVEALTMGDRVAVLKDGLLQQVDTPRNMYDRPANLFVAGFIGSPAMNLVEVPITDGGVKFGNSVVRVSRDALAAAADRGDKTVTVGVRPEHFDVVEHGGAAVGASLRKDDAADPAGVALTVNVVEELGADGYVYGSARVGGEDHKDLVVRVGGRAIPEKGSVLHVVPRSDEMHVFSTSTGERLSDV
ncbi:sn-glycerol-3-phosphate ABC transporter ATP-binding protein UgpC [Streptomyces sp. NPDC046887]|uniref:ABC transporter ATP-binding protein n=1 Tax=Streptomyces sp. NPDC046887 TaxID=3155472 RepID=UPI00340EFB1B